jgi:hypothetical protein
MNMCRCVLIEIWAIEKGRWAHGAVLDDPRGGRRGGGFVDRVAVAGGCNRYRWKEEIETVRMSLKWACGDVY